MSCALDRVARWAVSIFLFFFPFFLILSFNIFPFWNRFGLRWQVLCVSALVASSAILIRRDGWLEFSFWFRQTSWVWITPLLLAWLGVMGVRYGFAGFQLDSISAMAYLAVLLPIACFSIRRWISISMVNALVVMLIIAGLLEVIFLILYNLVGIGWFQSFIISGLNLPRLFLNTRDGNAVFLALGCLCVCLVIRSLSAGRADLPLAPASLSMSKVLAVNSENSLLPLCGLVVVWMNCFLTEGRALLVAMLLPLLAVRCLYLLSSFVWIRLCAMYLISMSFAVVFNFVLRWVLAAYLGVEVWPEEGLSVGLLGLDSGDAGRWVLWSSWLRSGWESSIVFGHGLGFEPVEYLPPGSWPADPHNIFISVVADSGLLGLFVIAVSVCSGVRRLNQVKVLREPAFAFSSLSFLVFSTLSAVYGWSSGVWSTLIVLIASSSYLFCSRPQGLREQFSEAVQNTRRGSISFVGIMVVFALCLLQVLLVTSKQIIAIPRFLLDIEASQWPSG